MDKPSFIMSVRRGGAKLRAMSKAHTPLHVMIWQAREAQSALLAAATAQKTLFSDIASWASQENRALSDVCSSASELSSLYSGVQVQIALAYKSFRKDMMLILEGEKRCDGAQRKLQEAEEKRLKLRRQVLKIQNKRLVEGENPRRSADFTGLQTQLAEAERTADRLHVEACDASREQEAVKLVVVRSALAKLSESHLVMSSQSRVIFEANRELTLELPEPPPPGDPLSCLRYNGHETTRAVIERVKSQVQVNSPTNYTSPGQPVFTSTPTHRPTAPPDSNAQTDPPPPYNASLFRNEHDDYRRRRRSTSSARRSLYNNAVSPSPPASGHTRSNSSGSPYGRNPPENPFTVQDSIHSSTVPRY
ncbi:unnamed protein product [Allacma fusca]|uniref:Uncharacterized protein n=1 Tax=Allacma fusca TaxID=39272 RepID=A0A8J2LRC1_9HEXA|nr:unnamed protein product [Allacma fusca]